MVRFHWHVEDGFGAFIPVGGLMPHKDPKVPQDQQVQHAIVEIEVRESVRTRGKLPYEL